MHLYIMALSKRMVSLRSLFPVRTMYRFKPNRNSSRVLHMVRDHPGYSVRFVSTGESVQQEALEQKTKTEIKKKPIETVKRSPFVANMFLGKYDKEVLPYPEVLDKEQLASLDDLYFTVKDFFKNNVNSQQIDKEGAISEKILEGLKDLGLFGQKIPADYGGLDLTWTEYARLAEITGTDWSIQATLAAHGSLATQIILKCGTEEQKAKYLPKLATGEHVAALCFAESSSGNDADRLQTKASLNNDATHYLLNGNKIWITNGLIADLFIVFAMTPDFEGKVYNKLTAFIVNKSSDGIQIGEKQESFGVRAANICSVKFEDTPLPVDDILGEVGGGYKVLKEMHSDGRFFFGPAACGFLKGLLDEITEYTINRDQFEKPLIQHPLIQKKIGKMACITYAIESMVYITAGLMDTGEDPDCSVETAILRVFSTEGLLWCINESLQIMGGMSFSKDHPLSRCLRDSRTMMMFEGTNEVIRLYIALFGCSQYGEHFSESVKKLRNSLMNPLFTLKNLIKEHQLKSHSSKLKMDLAGYLHPSLTPLADLLERDVMKFQYAVGTVLRFSGAEVIQEGLQLKRLADIAIDLYAMTACLSRASRSYCIGLRNGDHEMLLASTFCREAHERIEKNVKDVENAPFANTDANYREIAGRMMKFRGYAAEHPLKRNY